MKTIQELYDEVMASQELKEKFIEAANAGSQEAFLKEHGCEATLEEVAAFLEAKSEEDAPLSLDELEDSAGGKCTAQTGGEAAVSALTAGLGCLIWHGVSECGKLAGKATVGLGQDYGDGGRLCNFK